MPARSVVRRTLVLLLLFHALAARAEDLSFGIVNQSAAALNEFYASPIGNDSWGANILAGDPVPAGASRQVSIREARGCDYDLRMVFADGDALEDTSNICAAASYTIH